MGTLLPDSGSTRTKRNPLTPCMGRHYPFLFEGKIKLHIVCLLAFRALRPKFTFKVVLESVPRMFLI